MSALYRKDWRSPFLQEMGNGEDLDAIFGGTTNHYSSNVVGVEIFSIYFLIIMFLKKINEINVIYE